MGLNRGLGGIGYDVELLNIEGTFLMGHPKGSLLLNFASLHRQGCKCKNQLNAYI